MDIGRNTASLDEGTPYGATDDVAGPPQCKTHATLHALWGCTGQLSWLLPMHTTAPQDGRS
eukprot:6778118-Lingulodinium_polyedra.AAC.1